MTLVEELSGFGELAWDNRVLHRVRYQIRRYQGMAGSGLPVPGVFRIEGSIDADSAKSAADWLDVPLTLRLEDGRALAITLADTSGRVLSEGHGPSRCLCC
jgi:hypothetical protein